MELIKNTSSGYQSVVKRYLIAAENDLEESKKVSDANFARDIGQFLLDCEFVKKTTKYNAKDGSVEYTLQMVVLKQP